MFTCVHCVSAEHVGQRIRESLPSSTDGKRVQVSFNKKGVLSSPSEALQRKAKNRVDKIITF